MANELYASGRRYFENLSKPRSDVLNKAAAMDDAALIAFISDPSSPDADLLVPCPHRKCGASEGVDCLGSTVSPGVVHFSRHLKRLMLVVGAKKR